MDAAAAHMYAYAHPLRVRMLAFGLDPERKDLRRLRKKKGKKEKPILYEAYLQKKYRNCNKEEDADIGDMLFTSVKNILWLSWNLFLYAMTGIAFLMLLNESTRRAFCDLLLHK